MVEFAMKKMFRVIDENNCWADDNGYAVVEFWTFIADNVIHITKENVPARDYMDLPYLYEEIIVKEKEKYPDD